MKFSRKRKSLLSLPKHSGFTLVEVLVSLAILGILAALAAPSFSEAIRRYQVNAIRDDLIGSIQWARSEAIRRGFPIILVRTTGCGVTLLDTNDWGCGWQAVVDTNLNGVDDTGAPTNEPVIQTSTVPASYGINHAGPVGVRIVINKWGQAAGGNSFVLTPPGGVSGAATTTICMSSGGRIRYLPDQVACP
ncbi:GspH/FimT family pseudopilin [Polaromonas hydrogenivorans]|uniref:Type II secretion system protein H n=1 Tax=Polaromonas hydrogenivorans TaxID=335476 RepID=A0AAU7LUS0_9BURK